MLKQKIIIVNFMAFNVRCREVYYGITVVEAKRRLSTICESHEIIELNEYDTTLIHTEGKGEKALFVGTEVCANIPEHPLKK